MKSSYTEVINITDSQRSEHNTRATSQAGNPNGLFGRLSTYFMNLGHQKMAVWALNNISISKDATILDIGCGGGRMAGNLSKIA